MRRFGAGALAAALLAAVAAAQAPATKGDKEESTWWSGLFGAKAKAEPKKPAGDGSKTVADKAAEHDRLSRAYIRRLAVCTQLRQVAMETNNEGLEGEANRLEEIAWRLYSQQSSKLLGVAAVGMVDDPEAVTTKPTASGPRPAGGGPLPPRLRSSGSMGTRGGPTASRSGEDER